MRAVIPRFVLSLFLFGLAACAGDDRLESVDFEAPETKVVYEVELTGLPTEDMVDLAEESLEVYRRQGDGAMSLAFLKRRARGDIPTLQKLLRSRGYFKGRIESQVTEGKTDDNGKTAALVTFTVTPGNAFTLANHGFVLNDPSATANLPDATEFGSPVGSAAVAEAIVTAETAAVTRLTRTGFPYAENAGRDAVADLETETLEVRTAFDTGPAAMFGPIEFRGLDRVRERYLRTYIPWDDGERWDERKIRAFQRALLGTDLFSALTVRAPTKPPAEAGPAPLPVIVEAKERPFRTASAGLSYSTDVSGSVNGGFEHRNLFGENETLTIQANAGFQELLFGIGYREPQFLRNGQDLFAGITSKREENDAYDATTLSATLGIERRLSPAWLVGAGILLSSGDVTAQRRTDRANLIGLPTFAEWDVTDDLLNPTTGYRARFDVTPFGGKFANEPTSFLTIDTRASAYLDLTGAEDYIFAVRTRLGSALSENFGRIPANQRLYSGGGGSVRGYGARFVGPIDRFGRPLGGRSVLELGAEMRAKLWGDLGAVAFVEAGTASVEMYPDFEEILVAAGLGVRYYSPAGPVRIDVAFPLNPRAVDDAFQFYFSIGQAF